MIKTDRTLTEVSKINGWSSKWRKSTSRIVIEQTHYVVAVVKTKQKQTATKQQPAKHAGAESLDSPTTRNKIELHRVNSKNNFQTYNDCPHKFDENNLGSKLVRLKS